MSRAIRLSKKICELCGIKPKVIYDYENNEILIYPDFYNETNFVKLMEIKPFNSKFESNKIIKNLTILNVLYSFDVISNRIECLKSLVSLIIWNYPSITISRQPNEKLVVEEGTIRMRNAIQRVKWNIDKF